MKCSKCGRISPDGSKVCMICGAPFSGQKYCPNCKKFIDESAVFCPQCGQNLSVNETGSVQHKKKPVQEKQHGIAWKVFSWAGFVFGVLLSLAYMTSFASFLLLLFALISMPVNALQNFWKSAKIKGAVKGILLAALFFIGASLSPGSSKENGDVLKINDENIQETIIKDENQKNEAPEDFSSPEPDKKALVADTSFDTTGYMNIDSEVLFEYGGYLSGQNVVTVITAEDVDTYSGMVKAKTTNNNGYFFSIVCEFSDKSVIESLEEGAVITVAGTIKEKNPLAETISFLNTPTATLENCSIIGFGEIENELKGTVEEQRTAGERAKQSYEAQIAAANQQEKDSYIAQCETVTYSDVERNPDNYDGKLVKFTGKVVQVSEGWFDSVTMRIDSGGNMWYVTYTRSEGESRILEDDRITCYGECDGVTSYTTVLGAQVTIPSMSMKYYE